MNRAIFLNHLAFQARVWVLQDIKMQDHVVCWTFESRFVHLNFKTNPSEIHFKNSVLSVYSIKIWVAVLKLASIKFVTGRQGLPKNVKQFFSKLY